MTTDEEQNMPQFIMEIPNSEETISSTIIVSVLTRIIRTYKWYEQFDFNYTLLGVNSLVKGSEIDLPTQDRSQQRLTTDEKVMVEVSERYNEEAVRATHIKQGTQKNIFECEKTRTTMHPGYQQMIADITMKFRFRSRHSAENFRKRVRLASTKSVDGMRIEVKYSYTIPYAFLDILKRIYELMENKHGYGLSLGQWLRESFTDNLTTLANQSGGKSVLAMNEVNQNVLVLVNSPDEIDQKEKESDEDSYSVTMQFEVFYDRPDVMRIRFQHLINNQFIGMDIANRFKVLKQDYLKARTHMAQLDAIQSGEIPIGRNPLSGANSPIFDDWLAPSPNLKYPDLIRAMIVLDENNLTNILDLTDLADYELTEATLNWLRKTHNTVTEFGKNIFWIRLWVWDKFGNYYKYHLNDQLQLNSETPLNPRNNYHVTIGVNLNPETLDDQTWEELRHDRDMLEEWIKVASPNLGNVVNDLLVDYNEKYRDTSEVRYFDDPPPFDPTQVTTLPHYVIERLREVIAYPNIGSQYDPSHPNLNHVTKDGKTIMPNPRIPVRYRNSALTKTVMIHGILAKRKGIKYA